LLITIFQKDGLLKVLQYRGNWLASNNQWLVPIGGGHGKTFQIGTKSKLFYSAAAQVFIM
jgi:hypothetical protein